VNLTTESAEIESLRQRIIRLEADLRRADKAWAGVVADFRARAVEHCEDEAASWKREAGHGSSDYSRACRERAELCNRLAKEIKEL